MYLSELCQKGCSIRYEHDSKSRVPYFGVSTVERIVFLYNVNPERPEDWKNIEDLLRQADSAYKGVEFRNQ